MNKFCNNNKRNSRVFLSAHNSAGPGKDTGTMRRHSVEVSKLPEPELTRSMDPNRNQDNQGGRGELLTPQGTTFQTTYVTKEKKGMLARFLPHKVSFSLVDFN